MAYTLRIKPAVSQTLLYDLCGSTLGLIFDLSVPSTSVIIEPILNITSLAVGGQCPGVLAIRSSVDRGFTCGIGEVLNADKEGQIPNCCKSLSLFLKNYYHLSSKLNIKN